MNLKIGHNCLSLDIKFSSEECNEKLQRKIRDSGTVKYRKSSRRKERDRNNN
jgi:hypothetical protein